MIDTDKFTFIEIKIISHEAYRRIISINYIFIFTSINFSLLITRASRFEKNPIV